jgi:hypothetical protein
LISCRYLSLFSTTGKDTKTIFFFNKNIYPKLGSWILSFLMQRRRDSQSGEAVSDKNVANVEVLPVINSNTQLETSNIGTGNTSTLVTLKKKISAPLCVSALKSTAFLGLYSLSIVIMRHAHNTIYTTK